MIRFKVIADLFEVLKITERIHREIMDMIMKIQISLFAREAAVLAGIIEQGIYVALVLMSLLTTLITPLIFRNWLYKCELRYPEAEKS
jgi:Kef-type K+ transport system membrane component KefB